MFETIPSVLMRDLMVVHVGYEWVDSSSIPTNPPPAVCELELAKTPQGVAEMGASD